MAAAAAAQKRVRHLVEEQRRRVRDSNGPCSRCRAPSLHGISTRPRCCGSRAISDGCSVGGVPTRTPLMHSRRHRPNPLCATAKGAYGILARFWFPLLPSTAELSATGCEAVQKQPCALASLFRHLLPMSCRQGHQRAFLKSEYSELLPSP